MLLFLKKKNEPAPKNDTPSSGATPSVVHNNVAEFVPYDCHINPHTLLTKNGEVIQTIKIASNTLGLDYEGGNTDPKAVPINVRDIVRRAVKNHINSDKFAFWIHTMRKRKDVNYKTPGDGGFDAYVHSRWQKKNAWKHQFHNEIYVTLLYDGQSADLVDKKHMKEVIVPLKNRQLRNDYIDRASAELDTVILKMMDEIRPYYNVQRLAISERIPDQAEIPIMQPIFYSELMEFISAVLNMQESKCPLPEIDLSIALTTHNITFGFNALETRDDSGKRRFGAVLSLKQYRELSPDTVDRILQAPMEFIITQSFSFLPSEQALAPYKEQKEVFDMSGDEQCLVASGINEMLKSNKKSDTDFCHYQTTINVMVDEYKQLDAEVAKIQAIFSNIGLITIREDIRLEECFWSQLPGNFEFIRRKEIINTERAGGFCRLNRFPNGTEKGNHWGDAVTMMPTNVNSPYFFNFHVNDNGHSVVFDFNSFGDNAGNALLNFLICETRKYQGNLFIFDRHNSAELFFDRLNGDYHHFPGPRPTYAEGQSDQGLNLNPFTLENTPRNLAFLLAWCTSLVSQNAPLDPESKEHLSHCIEKVYENPPESRNIMKLVDYLAEFDMYFAKQFVALKHDGIFNGLIGANENLNMQHNVHAFEMGSIVQNKHAIIPVFSYLMHRIINTLDGRPTIIMLHEAWDLLENDFFAPRLESLLDMLQQNNVMVIFTTRKPFNCTETSTFETIMQKCQTVLYIPDDIAHLYASAKLGLNEVDQQMLIKLERQNGHFMLKQKNETIALAVDLRDLEDVYSIMSNDIKSLSAAGGKYAVNKTTTKANPK
jgi:type IV secretion system protein VirB4